MEKTNDKTERERELRNILPTPTRKEVLEDLRAKIQAEGMTEKLPLWKGEGILLDGYQRAEICRELGLKYETFEVECSSFEEAKAYRLFVNITCRRQLNEWQRCKAVLSQKAFWSSIVKERMRLSKGRGQKGCRETNNLFSQPFLQKVADLFKATADGGIRTMEILARLAQVSLPMIQAADYVLTKGPEVMPAHAWEGFRDELDNGEAKVGTVKNDIKVRERNNAKAKSRRKEREAQPDYKNPEGWVNRILCMDVLEGLRQIPDDSVTIIPISPPYAGVGLDYDGFFDPNQQYSAYQSWLMKVWAECKRVLRVGGRICVNVDEAKAREELPYASYVYDVSTDISLQMRELGLIKHRTILWNKQNVTGKKARYGNPYCPSPRPNWEYILTFCKGQIVLPQIGEFGSDKTNKELANDTLNCWDIGPVASAKSSFNHPCPFPPAIPERLIRLWSYPGDVVLDCFNGSGTTTSVAARMNRRWVGIDIVPRHCVTAEKRTKEAYAQREPLKAKTVSINLIPENVGVQKKSA